MLLIPQLRRLAVFYCIAELCNRVCFVSEGKIIAEDTPQNLKIKYGEHSITALLRNADGSTHETIANPRYFGLTADKLKLKQQALARHKRGSTRRAETKRQVVNLHRHIANQRRDFAHKLSRRLVDSYGTIVFEDLQIGSMTRRPTPKPGDAAAGEAEYLPNGAAAKSGLNREILGAGWGMQMCVVKAESAGRHVLFVPPHNTSRRCSSGGYTAANNRTTQADFYCQSCGLGMNADVNAAINIQRLGSNRRDNQRIEA